MHKRLSILAAVDAGAAESEALQLALQQAVAEFRGLGGLVHLRGPGPAASLCLAAANGLPSAVTDPWEDIRPGAPAAPDRALQEGGRIWEPVGSLPGLPPDACVAAVPMATRERTVGTFTVVLGTHREPGPGRWKFLESVAAWTADRVHHASVPDSPPAAEAPGIRLQQTLSAVDVGSWEWDIRTGKLTWDETAMAACGITDPATFVPKLESWVDTIHPDDLSRVLTDIDRSVRTGELYKIEYRLSNQTRGTRWVSGRAKVVFDENGEPVRMVGTAWDSTESRAARDSVSRALRYMSDAFLSVHDDWHIAFVNREAERLLGPAHELTGRVLWDVPALAQVPGLESECRRVASGGGPAVLDVQGLHPGSWHRLRLVSVPDGLTCYFTDTTEKRQRDLERVEAEHADAARAAHMKELTKALAEAITSRDVVKAVAQRVLPPFGASGLIMLTIEGDRLHVVGAIGSHHPFLDRINGIPLSKHSVATDVLRTRAPLFISSPEEYARYPDDELARIPETRAWTFLPLIASRHPIGLCVISFERPRQFAGEERTLLAALSGLVAQALERARLYDAEHIRAQELQRGLLPRALPTVPGCAFTARYLPTEQGMGVGGDWYDVIPLSAGRVALVIGDVMGHGLSEAATMGRLRTAVRTLADLELPPDEVMGHLNDIVGDLGNDLYVTCLYSVYDPTNQICSFTLAGHPPPAIGRPDGKVYFPDIAPDPPLGIAKPPLNTVELHIPDGSLLAFYTDGLVESIDRDIDAGMAQLALILKAGHNDDLDQLCDTLTARLLQDRQPTADDAALLVARVHSMASDSVASWPLPKDPRAAGDARRHVCRQLAEWRLDDLAMATELIASELVGNVVRHARGPISLRLLRSQTLICEVSDGSHTMPRIRHAAETDEGGRGLQLVAALSDRWGARYTSMGKYIWTEQAMDGPDASTTPGHASRSVPRIGAGQRDPTR